MEGQESQIEANSVAKQRSIYTYAKDNIIREGDNVIIFEGPDALKQVQMKRDAVFQNRFGAFPHNEIIDSEKFGSKIFSKNRTGWVYILKPNSHLHTTSLAQRTQILYTPDISQVLFKLELQPGFRVVESGTGSGSLSVSIIRSILPNGHLFTYEFNEVRSVKAKEDFERLGISNNATVTHRDVLTNGFLLNKDDEVVVGENSIDAVFLDLPSPQVAVPHAYKVLRKQGKLCNFSPCIEQVQKAVEQMALCGFYEIRTFETLSREYMNTNFQYDCIKKRKDEPKEQEGNNGGEAGEAQKGQKKREKKQKDKSMLTPVPKTEIRGHTGYLTFAIKF